MGYHGTSLAKVSRILAIGFESSNGDGDWLGHGVYFWPNKEAAWLWAEQKYGRTAAVIEAELHLGYCLDLNDTRTFSELIQKVEQEIESLHTRQQTPIPQNIGDQRCFDCELYNLVSERTIPPVDSVVRVFNDGELVSTRTDLRKKTQLQICIRNSSKILSKTQVWKAP
jgi:hypothetical protein